MYMYMYMYILRIIHNIAGLTSSQGVCCLLNHSKNHMQLSGSQRRQDLRVLQAGSQGKRIDSLVNKWKRNPEKIVVNLLDFHMFYPGLVSTTKYD